MQSTILSPSSPSRTALVIGANGFTGGFVAAAMRERGWRVLRGIRSESAALANRVADDEERYCDLTRMLTPDMWHEALAGVDAVINVAGILREAGPQTFDTIHIAAPTAMAQACIEAGVASVVQISALGVAEDGEFVASKHRFDEILLAMPLRAVVLRPSVVYATVGSYGGTSLLRALSAFPGFQLLPGDGRWSIQPISAEDLGELAARAAEGTSRGIYEVGGPAPMTLRAYQNCWRSWMRIPSAVVVQVPEAWVSWQVWISERLGRGPVGETMWRMLRRGNITQSDAPYRLKQDFGFSPRALRDVLAARPSQVQDRWQAQLYFLAPTLRIAIVALWVLSALTGWTTSASQIESLVAGSSLQPGATVTLARVAASIDLVLAAWLAAGWRPRWAIGLMGLSVVAYTGVFGVLLPTLWLDPLGGLVKNLVVLPALAVAWILADRR